MQIIEAKMLDKNGFIYIEALLSELKKYYSQERFATIMSAFDILSNVGVGEKYITDIDCFEYGIEMAYILFTIKADEDTIASALLFEIYHRHLIDNDLILEKCGEDVLRILRGTKKISAIKTSSHEITSLSQIDIFRKMILTIVEDIRIVLVKIADKLCAIRKIKKFPTVISDRTVREIQEIYAPLTNRLGLSDIKWELEDRTFFYSKPKEYKFIAKSLGRTRIEREHYIRNIAKKLEQYLTKENIFATISARVKHIYSIWKKLQRKNSTNINDLFDIRAVRIICKDIDDCYKALAIVNDIWFPIAKEFDDYIANPKHNGYRSIHTVVKGPEGLAVEVQIRTEDMHQESELGFASHWRYKEGVKYDPSYDARVAWLRSILEWESELKSSDSFEEQEKDKKIYAFTPNGDVLDLSYGSTVLDFAYRIHSMVGHRSKGAKVAGKIVPLTTKVKMGDKIEIMTHNKPQPNNEWAHKKSGYLHSAKNRSRVIKWFNEQNKENNVALGKDKIANELKEYNLKEINYQDVANKFNVNTLDGFFAGIEIGTLRLHAIINYIIDKYSADRNIISEKFYSSKEYVKKGQEQKHHVKKSQVLIYGLSNMMYSFSKCCNPEPDADIIGYLTIGKGVSIHRRDCKNVPNLIAQNKERIITVKWLSEEE